MSAQDTSSPIASGVVASSVLLAIRAYQRWISPYKGFHCAHAMLHGGPGCSGYAAEAIRSLGVIGALGPIRVRFRDCRAAFETLASQRQEEQQDDGAPEKPKKEGAVSKYCPAACVDCDLGAAPGGVACGSAGAGAEAAGSACSAASCCS